MKAADKLKMLIPFAPLIMIFVILIIKPYFLFPVGGDTDFHLVRAREILQNPVLGLFWNYLTYHPLGRPLWHPPLFNAVYAFLWFLGGVRFAQSFLCVFQILLTVGVASWIANKEYGILAGFFAGIFALTVPAPSTFIVPIPATYIPIFAVLTIYFMPRDKKKAFITSLIGIWTHMIGLVAFIPLFLVDNYKDKTNQRIIALLLPSWLFWVGYWIYFKDRLVTGGVFYSITHLKFISVYPTSYAFYIFIPLYIMGIVGLYFLYKSNIKQFKLFSTYIILVILFSFFGFNGDFMRGFQFIALPMAILSGLTVQRGYEYLSKNQRHIFSSVFIWGMVGISILGALIFFGDLPDQHGKGWDALNYPFEEKYAPLKYYIEDNTNRNAVIWAEPELTEKVAWMTGRKVSNGLYPDGVYGGARGFVESHQKLNIYQSDGFFLIKDFNNITLEKINMLTIN